MQQRPIPKRPYKFLASNDGRPRSHSPAFALALCLMVVPVLGRASAQAQVAPGTVTGVVRDASGSPVPGATVRAVAESTATVAETTSDMAGTYRLANLGPGSYRIETELSGFETAVTPIRILGSEVATVDVSLLLAAFTEGIIVTARRIEESVQEVPIPLSVVTGATMANSGAFNVNRLKELIPTVQFYSTNPRNSSINVRGLGAPFGLTNDGIEPGVGLYVDGVFHARPAAAALDFLDVERLEVLRGPQGTLFGKNTTAGAISVTTRRPSFTTETDFELNYGSNGFLQAKGSASGRLLPKLAGRVSFSGTTRDGMVLNSGTGTRVNNMDNLGLRGQVLFAPSDALAVTIALDHTRQRPDGYTQVVAGVAPTLRAPNRQFPQIAADLGYTPPSYNAFDRLTDVDTPLRSHQDMGGSSLSIDWKAGDGRVNLTTAWRYWDWNPSNDRDFIGLPITTVSAAPSTQGQLTQEIRYGGDMTPRLNLVAGAFFFRQALDSAPFFRQEQGPAAARFLLAPSANAATPGLLDGYGFNQSLRFRNVSSALFGQLAWSATDRLRILPGLRINYDQKEVDFDQTVSGGLQTTNAALIALKRSVLAPQAYRADVDDANVSGQLTLALEVTERANAFATYAKGFKSVGLNLNGVPTDANDEPVLSAATVKPEDVVHVEFGLKTTPRPGLTANVTVYDTTVRDFQAQVVNASVGVLRGYLANAEKVRVRGVELDTNLRVHQSLSLYGAAAYTDGRYVAFRDAPPPLEDTGGPAVKDISGSLLPGISKWAVSYGGEYSIQEGALARFGELVGAIDASYRSWFSSSPSFSKYLVVEGYSVVNGRIGFRRPNGWTLTVWARNLLNRDYYELLNAAPGNTGLFVGQPADFRTVGITLRLSTR